MNLIMRAQHLSCVRSIGRNIKHLIDRPDEDYCFRLHKDRVYYVSEAVMRKATCVNRKQLMSVGTCFGKFTKTLKFRLHITALDYISQYAKYKVWVKPSSELSYLYGNNVLKAGLGRITENTPQYQVMSIQAHCKPLPGNITENTPQTGRITENTPLYQVMYLHIEYETVIPSVLDWVAYIERRKPRGTR